jgi:DNA repair protein RecO (recombination protein O)
LTQGVLTAYLIHRQALSESRFYVTLITAERGLCRLWARRPPKKQPLPQLFQPLCVQLRDLPHGSYWQGAESLAMADLPGTQGPALYCGLYMNELIMQLLPEGEGRVLFEQYRHTLQILAASSDPGRVGEAAEWALRHWEWSLLQQLGLGHGCDATAAGVPFNPGANYRWSVTQGWREITAASPKVQAAQLPGVFPGDFLRRLPPILAGQAAAGPGDLPLAKQLMRVWLNPLLTKPLKSRELFRPPTRHSFAEDSVSC